MGRKLRKSPQRKSKEPIIGKDQQSKGWADVVIRLIDALHDLAQTGNLIGLIVFGFVVWVFLVTYRIPPDSIGGFFGGFGNFLADEKFYLFPLGAALVVSVITNIVQAIVYKEHIHDLTEHRKHLIHGLQTGKLKPLETHRTSGFDVKSNSVKNGLGEENARG